MLWMESNGWGSPGSLSDHFVAFWPAQSWKDCLVPLSDKDSDCQVVNDNVGVWDDSRIELLYMETCGR